LFFQAYLNPNIEYIHVSTGDIVRILTITLSLNIIILLIWTIISPLEWIRKEKDTTDIFDRATESYGVCASDNSLPFTLMLVLLNGFVLAVGIIWALISRNVETECNENVYIGTSLAAVLQAWLMGLPILNVVVDNVQARFYVGVGIMFVTAQSLISLTFIPKMMTLRSERRKTTKVTNMETKSNEQPKSDEVDRQNLGGQEIIESSDCSSNAEINDPGDEIVDLDEVPSNPPKDRAYLSKSFAQQNPEPTPHIMERAASAMTLKSYRALYRTTSVNTMPSNRGFKVTYNPRVSNGVKTITFSLIFFYNGFLTYNGVCLGVGKFTAYRRF
jgi:7 transmembrane sweet-taste receptor of 3 GCPR/Membrane transport protein